MNEIIIQFFLSVLSITAILLVARKNRWGFVVGLLSQQFWIYTSFTHAQWGIFTISVVYVFVWCYGIYEWFYKNEK